MCLVSLENEVYFIFQFHLMVDWLPLNVVSWQRVCQA